MPGYPVLDLGRAELGRRGREPGERGFRAERRDGEARLRGPGGRRRADTTSQAGRFPLRSSPQPEPASPPMRARPSPAILPA